MKRSLNGRNDSPNVPIFTRCHWTFLSESGRSPLAFVLYLMVILNPLKRIFLAVERSFSAGRRTAGRAVVTCYNLNRRLVRRTAPCHRSSCGPGHLHCSGPPRIPRHCLGSQQQSNLLRSPTSG